MNDNTYGKDGITYKNIDGEWVPIESEKKEECLHHHIENGRCVRGCFDGEKKEDTTGYFPKGEIERLTEERCTKCNGVGKVLSLPYAVEPDTVCHHCNGTGKEPRKEEIPVSSSHDSTHETGMVCKTCNEIINKERLESKLSRYRTALEKIINKFGEPAPSDWKESHREFGRSISDIARTALEKLKGELCEYCKKPKGNCAICINYEDSSQEMKEVLKGYAKNFPQTDSVSGGCIMSCSRHCIGSGGGNGAEKGRLV